jgi:hypothetical protein
MRLMECFLMIRKDNNTMHIAKVDIVETSVDLVDEDSMVADSI